MKLVDLPRRSGQRFEIALDARAGPEMRRLLAGHGWHVLDAASVASDPDSFREYVQGSWAEFSVAKGAYVETSSGWFSERTIRYLASGRPRWCRTRASRERCPSAKGCSHSVRFEEAVQGPHVRSTRTTTATGARRRVAEESFRLRRRAGALPRGRQRGAVTRPLTVLGMMRSGTSAVAGVLDALGVSFGPPARWLEPNDASDRLPRAQGHHHPERQAARPARRDLVRASRPDAGLGEGSGARRPPHSSSLDHRARPRDVRALGVEGPRTSLTLPFWHGLVPTVAHVICVRNPTEAARSLAALEWARKRIEDPYHVGLDLWLRFDERARAHAREEAYRRLLRRSPREPARRGRSPRSVRRPGE